MKNKMSHIKKEARKFLPLLFSAALLPEQADGQTSHSSRGNHQHVIQNNNQSLQVEYNGEISVSPDGLRITAISDGGYLRIQKTISGNSKQISIRNAAGDLQYEYSENGQRLAFDPEGKTWLTEILPELMRSSAIGAPSRVNQLHEKGGTPLVLSEIGGLTNDQVRAQYFTLLLKKDIQPHELPLIISAIGKTLDSDHKKIQLIQLVLENPLPANQQEQVLQLANSLRNDHFRTEILKKLLQQKVTNDAVQWMAENLLPAFRSDHSRNELIEKILETQTHLSSNTLEKLIGSMSTGRRSFFNRVLLEKIIHHPGITGRNIETLLSLLSQFHSDHDKVEMIKVLIRTGKLKPYLSQLLREAAQIRSDHSRIEVLETLIEHLVLEEDQFIEVINSATSIRNDSYKANFLKKACKQAKNAKAKEAIRQAAKSIRSSHQYEEVLKCIE